MSEKQFTFKEFRTANVARCLKWHPDGIESWSPSDWMVAIMGELGELASLIKMRNRERDGLPGNKFSPTDKQIADEAADVYTYLDLFCELHGIDIGQAVAEKFNEVSERVGFPDRIQLEDLGDYYVLRNAGDCVFVKEAQFFEAQGGLVAPWGQAWTKVRARDIEHARIIGEKVLPRSGRDKWSTRT